MKHKPLITLTPNELTTVIGVGLNPTLNKLFTRLGNDRKNLNIGCQHTDEDSYNDCNYSEIFHLDCDEYPDYHDMCYQDGQVH